MTKADAGRHQRLKQLFLAASEVAPQARQAWLAAECPDANLREEVARLLGVTRALATRALLPHADPGDPQEREDPTEASLPLPRMIGPYRLEEVLGRGGMGVVHGAVDTRIDRQVALKQLPDHFAGDEARDAFRREMRTLATLQHRNIALLYSLEEWDGVQVAALERVPGETLAARLADGPLDARAWLPIAHQICTALEIAHRAAIVHLDLKAANVMLTPAGEVKVLDFGIARSLGGGPELTAVAGTPGSIAPEVLRGEAPDPRADIFAFGVLWFQVLTGSLPFTGTTMEEWIAATLGGTFPRERIPVGVPDGTIEWLERCLAVDPTARPSEIAEVRRTIDGWIGTPRELPPLPRKRAKLPRRRESLVGRHDEIATVETALARSPVVTLTGIGGGGKTRLALEIAHRRAHASAQSAGGVHWVELAPVTTEEGIDEAVANAVDLPLQPNFAEQLQGRLTPSSDPAENPWLVLDNGEHLAEPLGRWVADLIAQAPEVRVLVTSRVPLGLGHEETISLGPLPVPDEHTPPPVARENEAVRRFIACAPEASLRRRDARTEDLDAATVATISRIVRRLDGIPLAIELAAARLRHVPLAELERRLDDRFRLLTGGAREFHPHQRTLRATLDWSTALLAPPQRTLLQRLGVFADGFTLHAAEVVCSDDSLAGFEILDALAALVDHSLVIVSEGASDGEVRYRMLATVAEYARGQFLEDPDRTRFEDTLITATADFFARHERAITGTDQLRWLRRLDQEHANIERCLSLAVDSPERAVEGVRIACAVWQGWEMRQRSRFGLASLDRLLPIAAALLPGRLHAQALNVRASLAQHLGEYDRALADFDRCLERCRAEGWESAIGTVQMNSAILVKARGDFAEARRRYNAALTTFRELEHPHNELLVRTNLAILDEHEGNIPAALEGAERALEIAEELGDRSSQASLHTLRGNVHRHRGAIEEAIAAHERAIALQRDLGDLDGVARALNNRALVRGDAGDPEGELEDHQEALRLRREGGDKRGIAISLVNLVPTLTQLGRLAEARGYLPELTTLLVDLDERRVGTHALAAAARLCAACNDAEHTLLFHRVAERVCSELGIAPPVPDRDRQRAERARAESALSSDQIEAIVERAEALTFAEALRSIPCILPA